MTQKASITIQLTLALRASSGYDRYARSLGGTKARQQVVCNVGMYFAAYRLSQMGWNVMPTSRNAWGIDLLAYVGREASGNPCLERTQDGGTSITERHSPAGAATCKAGASRYFPSRAEQASTSRLFQGD